MNKFMIVAAAVGVACLSACASYDRPVADRATYVAPRASLDPLIATAPGAGAAGGGGAGAVKR
jgi:outer membrane murein-binding lipoprotein Lpp